MFGRLRRKRAGTPQLADGTGPARTPVDGSRRAELNPDDPEYVALCLTPAFPEEPETRTIGESEFNRIVDVAGTSGWTSPAMIRLIGDLLTDPRYVALDDLYAWLAGAYQGTDRQLEVIDDALRTCPRKYRLLDLAGTAMLQGFRGADALYYWAQSVTNAESISEGEDATAYDFLIVVAEVIGQHAAARTFRARADQANHRPTSIDDEHTALVEIAFHKHTKPMAAVIQKLVDQIPVQ